MATNDATHTDAGALLAAGINNRPTKASVDAALATKANQTTVTALANLVPINAKQYGWVADYVGTPQYDGQDSTRVTCTDNTAALAAMLDDCIAKKELHVEFDAGHYGVKVGNVVRDLTGCKLTITGKGKSMSIIDYVHENTTYNSYVGETMADCLAKITNADTVVFRDLTIKATTNFNNINAAQTVNGAVYNGATWGILFNKIESLTLERVLIERFNYRGICTYLSGGWTNYNALSGKATIIDCEMRYNRGSGAWLNYLKEVEIVGGDFHHNGQRGTVGTGYGVTCSIYVGNVVIRGGARFHHNYRKGFDAHGCVNVSMDGAAFEDNVAYHWAVLGWGNALTEGAVDIRNITMTNGFSPSSRAWLEDAYTALVTVSSDAQKTGMLFDINERDQNGDPATAPIRKVKFTNVKVLAHYSGQDKNVNQARYAAAIYATVAETSWIDCDFDLTGLLISNNTTYGASIFQRICPSFKDRNTRIVVPVSMKFATGEYGAVYQTGAADIEFDNVIIKTVDGYIFGGTMGGKTIDPVIGNTNTRRYTNCLFEWSATTRWADTKNDAALPPTPLVPVTSPRFFGAIAPAGNAKLTMVDTYTKIGNTKYKMPPASQTDFDVPFTVTVASAPGVGANFADIVLEKVTNATFELTIDTGTATEVLRFTTRGADNATFTLVQDGATVTVPGVASFTDTDTIPRTKITLQAKTAQQSGTYVGRLRGVGSDYSWGLNRVVSPPLA